MPRKIAIYNLNSFPEMSGGSEISCIELATQLKKQGEDVSIIALNAFKKGFSKFTYNDFEIFKLPLLNIYWPTSNVKRSIFKKIIWNVIDVANIPMSIMLCLFLRKEGFNIIHTNNIKGTSPWFFPFLKLFGINVVHTTRDFYLLDSGAWYRDIEDRHDTLKLKIRRFNKRICSSFIDVIVFNSKYMQDYHVRCGYFKKQKKHVIYNGFNPEIYSEDNNKKNRNSEKYTFGYIGRLSKEKGIDDLFNSFIRFKNNEYQLVIAGATETDFDNIYPDLRKKLEVRTDIVFLGIVNSLDFYNNVNCVVVPSKYNEPFGRVAMESIFMGKDVIVSNKGGLPEQIVEGVNGLICKNHDYYDQMNYLANNIKQKKDVPISTTIFTICYSANKYLEAYDEACK